MVRGVRSASRGAGGVVLPLWQETGADALGQGAILPGDRAGRTKERSLRQRRQRRTTPLGQAHGAGTSGSGRGGGSRPSCTSGCCDAAGPGEQLVRRRPRPAPRPRSAVEQVAAEPAALEVGRDHHPADVPGLALGAAARRRRPGGRRRAPPRWSTRRGCATRSSKDSSQRRDRHARGWPAAPAPSRRAGQGEQLPGVGPGRRREVDGEVAEADLRRRVGEVGSARDGPSYGLGATPGGDRARGRRRAAPAGTSWPRQEAGLV